MWYRRAFFDDGSPLGASANAECRIDLIAQAWSVLSGAAPLTRQRLAMASARQLLADPAHGLKAGQKVFHNKFGEGKVLAIEGTGDDARAQVDFPRHGVKWLALSVAKLTPI